MLADIADLPGAGEAVMRALVGIILVGIILCGVVRVCGNDQGKHSPPAACQLAGGTWNIFDGWRCN